MEWNSKQSQFTAQLMAEQKIESESVGTIHFFDEMVLE